MKHLSTDKIINLFGVFNFALLLALSASLLFASPKSSEAATTSAQAGSSVYYANISNENSVSIPVTPTSTQTEYTKNANITFSNTCTAGSYIYISTNSDTNNALIRTGSDSGKKTIEAVAGDSVTGLTDNTWGYKTSGKAFTQVPLNTSPAVLYSSAKSETNTPVEVTYGVKVDNTLPSGTYSNDVVYTLVVDNKCLQYTLSFVDEDGTTKLYPDINVNYGDTVDLTAYTPTKTGYTFAGWTNGSSTFTGKVNPNTSNAMSVKLRAKQIKTIYNISTMQEMTSTICNNTTTPLTTATASTTSYSTNTSLVPEVTLKDTRDNNTYRIRKLADGNCWMTENLRLKLTNGSSLSNATTDLNSKTSWNPGHTTQTTFDTTWATTINETTINTPHSYNGGETSQTTDGETQYNGTYYNWYAATAGSGTYAKCWANANGTTDCNGASTALAEDSVCPKNWQIPSNQEGMKDSYKNLFLVTYNTPQKDDYNASHISDSEITKYRSAPFSFIASNLIYSNGAGFQDQKATALWSRYAWSKTSNNGAIFYPNYIHLQEANTKAAGRPIRCVAK